MGRLLFPFRLTSACGMVQTAENEARNPLLNAVAANDTIPEETVREEGGPNNNTETNHPNQPIFLLSLQLWVSILFLTSTRMPKMVSWR